MLKCLVSVFTEWILKNWEHWFLLLVSVPVDLRNFLVWCSNLLYNNLVNITLGILTKYNKTT